VIPEAEPHVRAVLAKLKAGLPVTVAAALGIGPAVAPPYVALYPDPGDIADAFLSGDRSQLVIHFTVNAVGVGPEQAIWAADKARVVMLDITPVSVVGRRVHRMTQAPGSSPPVIRDESVQPALYIATAGYRLMSQHAS
jgi:hypothetical protein